MIVTIKSGFRKLLNTPKLPEAYLITISWNVGGQKRFVIITQVGMSSKLTPKDKGLILQQS